MTRARKTPVRAVARSGRAVKSTKARAAADAPGLRDQVLDEVARLMMAAGFSPEDCTTAFAASAARHAKSDAQAAAVPAPGIIDSGHVVTHWYTSPDYLDDAGKPRSLPLRGVRSFTSLVQQSTPEFSPDDVLAFLLKTGTVVRRGSRLVPIARKVVFDATSEQFAIQSLETLHALLSTILRNQATPAIPDRLLELTVTNHRFPVSAFEPFRKRSHTRCTELMTDLDNEMVRIERRAKPKDPTMRVGVGVFLFQSSAPAKRRR